MLIILILVLNTNGEESQKFSSLNSLSTRKRFGRVWFEMKRFFAFIPENWIEFAEISSVFDQSADAFACVWVWWRCINGHQWNIITHLAYHCQHNRVVVARARLSSRSNRHAISNCYIYIFQSWHNITLWLLTHESTVFEIIRLTWCVLHTMAHVVIACRCCC